MEYEPILRLNSRSRGDQYPPGIVEPNGGVIDVLGCDLLLLLYDHST